MEHSKKIMEHFGVNILCSFQHFEAHDQCILTRQTRYHSLFIYCFTSRISILTFIESHHIGGEVY
jgi:hypothetical protein